MADAVCTEFINTGRCGHTDAEHDAIADGRPMTPDQPPAPRQDDEQAAGGVTLTQTERRTIGGDCGHIAGVWHHVRFCKAPAVERILTAHRDAAEAERADRVEALHRGMHKCGHDFWTDDSTYRGTIARVGICPTRAALAATTDGGA